MRQAATDRSKLSVTSSTQLIPSALRYSQDRRVMAVAALLSAIHLLTLALGAGAIFARGRAMSRPLDDQGWKRLLAADNLWGIAALLWIASGLACVLRRQGTRLLLAQRLFLAEDVAVSCGLRAGNRPDDDFHACPDRAEPRYSYPTIPHRDVPANQR